MSAGYIESNTFREIRVYKGLGIYIAKDVKVRKFTGEWNDDTHSLDNYILLMKNTNLIERLEIENSENTQDLPLVDIDFININGSRLCMRSAPVFCCFKNTIQVFGGVFCWLDNNLHEIKPAYIKLEQKKPYLMRFRYIINSEDL